MELYLSCPVYIVHRMYVDIKSRKENKMKRTYIMHFYFFKLIQNEMCWRLPESLVECSSLTWSCWVSFRIVDRLAISVVSAQFSFLFLSSSQRDPYSTSDSSVFLLTCGWYRSPVHWNPNLMSLSRFQSHINIKRCLISSDMKTNKVEEYKITW